MGGKKRTTNERKASLVFRAADAFSLSSSYSSSPLQRRLQTTIPRTREAGETAERVIV